MEAIVDLGTLDRARGGDSSAFDALVEARVGSMLRVAMAITGDEAEARDAVQDALVSAWRQLGVPARSRARSTRGSRGSWSIAAGAACGGAACGASTRCRSRRRMVSSNRGSRTSAKRSSSGAPSSEPSTGCRWTSGRSSCFTTWMADRCRPSRRSSGSPSGRPSRDSRRPGTRSSARCSGRRPDDHAADGRRAPGDARDAGGGRGAGRRPRGARGRSSGDRRARGARRGGRGLRPPPGRGRPPSSEDALGHRGGCGGRGARGGGPWRSRGAGAAQRDDAGRGRLVTTDRGVVAANGHGAVAADGTVRAGPPRDRHHAPGARQPVPHRRAGRQDRDRQGRRDPPPRAVPRFAIGFRRGLRLPPGRCAAGRRHRQGRPHACGGAGRDRLLRPDLARRPPGHRRRTAPARLAGRGLERAA